MGSVEVWEETISGVAWVIVRGCAPQREGTQFEKADESELEKTSWSRPERFVAKDRHDKYDIHHEQLLLYVSLLQKLILQKRYSFSFEYLDLCICGQRSAPAG